MIRIDPESGSFRLAGISEPLTPRVGYSAFLCHPARAAMPEISAGKHRNQHQHRLPEGRFEGCRVWGTASFIDGELESLWLQVLPHEQDGRLFRFEQDDPQLLALQERWLQGVVGVESRDDYAWGLVWNRFNINAGWHDIAVVFKPMSHDRKEDNRGGSKASNRKMA